MKLSEGWKRLIERAKKDGSAKGRIGKAIITMKANIPQKETTVFSEWEKDEENIIKSELIGYCMAVTKKGTHFKKGDILAIIIMLGHIQEVLAEEDGRVVKILAPEKNKNGYHLEIADFFDREDDDWPQREENWKKDYCDKGIVVQFGDPILKVKYKKRKK